jgi:signal transduction histidine kinase
MSPLALCDFEGSTLLIFGSNVAPLVYYSHIPTALAALLLASYLFIRNSRSLPHQLLLTIATAFASWSLLDLMFWATNRSDVVMATWAGTVLIEPLVHAAGFYLLYVLLGKRDLSFTWKLGLFILYLPLIVFGHTNLVLSGFDSSSCLANEGLIAQYYSYGLEIFLMIAVIGLAIRHLDLAKDWKRRGEIFILSSGVFLLMFAFSWGNIIGSFTDDWIIAQYGLFGMPIFVGFLMYAIVKYQSFNIRLVGAVALVLGLIATSFSLVFVRDVLVFREVATVTAVLSLVFGAILIRSVNRDVQQREHIEKLANDLQVINERQESLIHFIGHEVKGFLTKDMVAFATLVEGDAGTLPATARSFVEKALAQTREGVTSVMELLQASNQKKGTVVYQKEPFDLKTLAMEVVARFEENAKRKELTFGLTAPEGEQFMMKGDRVQIGDHVFRNLIDNAINYTPSGTVTVSLQRRGGMFVFSVSDTGIGLSEEDKARLFTEGGKGKESSKINVHSTGYGLFIAKNVVEAHGGKIWAESDGPGKGSKFTIELPI